MNVERFSLDLAEPLDTAAGRIERREGFLVRLTVDGEVGVGEATPLPGWTESVEECEAALQEAETAASGSDPQAALTSMPRSATAARHGISTALLDAAAQTANAPLCEWRADGQSAASVPVTATIGDRERTATVEAAQTAVTEGFTCCKLKVGARPVADDLDRVAAVRDAVGAAVELRVDANGNWDLAVAERALAALAEQDVSVVEQPLPAEELAGLAKLRGGPVDIALDESLVAHRPSEIVAADAADALVLKPMVLGGPGDAHTLATWARDRGLDVIVTTTIDAVVARTAAVHVAAAIPDVRACGLATAAWLASDLGPDPAPVADGRITVPAGPGLGIERVGR